MAAKLDVTGEVVWLLLASETMTGAAAIGTAINAQTSSVSILLHKHTAADDLCNAAGTEVQLGFFGDNSGKW